MLDFCIIYKRPTIVNSEWSRKQIQIIKDLLVLCVPCEQSPLVYPRKQRLLVSPRKMSMYPHDKYAIIIEICFFTKNLRSRLLSMRKSRKTDFRKLKITLVALTYPGQRPQCPSLSPHVLSAEETRQRARVMQMCRLSEYFEAWAYFFS